VGRTCGRTSSERDKVRRALPNGKVSLLRKNNVVGS
jgi:hypothetical protein